MSIRKKSLLKIMIVGDKGVGKTALFDQYVNEKFQRFYKPTISTDFLTKQIDIDDTAVTLQIWDTASNNTLGAAFYRGADGCILVYDITDKKSFESLQRLKDDFLDLAMPANSKRGDKCSSAGFPFVVFGNKLDKHSERQVPMCKGRSWSENNQFVSFEGSAKDATCVDDAFRKIAELGLNREKSSKAYVIPSWQPAKDTKRAISTVKGFGRFEKKAYQFAWLHFPILFLLASWCFLLNPNGTAEVVPSFGFGGVSSTMGDSLPLHPRSYHEAYELGVWSTLLVNDENVTEILSRANKKYGRDISKEDILQAETCILEMQNDEGIVTTFYGFFSFINFIWIVSIFGIVIVMGPFLSFVLSPVVKHIIVFWNATILPVLMVIEQNGGFVFLAFSFCFWLEVHGYRYPKDTGFYVTLTGSLLAAPSWFYAATKAESKNSSAKAFQMLTCIFLLLIWSPMAILYNSTLVGFLSVASGYHAAGFSVICTGLCWCIGFDSKKSLQRVVALSFIVIIYSISMKYMGWSRNSAFSPFATALNVFGSLTYFLGLLITSSRFYFYNDRNMYIKSNGLFVGSAMIILGFAFTLNITSLRNTVLTFMCIYLGEKVAELDIWRKTSWIYVGLMFFFVSLWRISLFLHSNPGHVVSMFDASWISS